MQKNTHRCPCNGVRRMVGTAFISAHYVCWHRIGEFSTLFVRCSKSAASGRKVSVRGEGQKRVAQTSDSSP